jgi:hypothetical protein
MRAKFINEKFEKDSDPIKDLGIGMIKFYRNKFIEKGQMDSIEGSKQYFASEDYPQESFTIYKILQYIVTHNITGYEKLAKAAKFVIKDRGYTEEENKAEIELMKKALKDHLYIDLY